MTEKQYTLKELNSVFDKVIEDYVIHYRDGKMTFSEFVIMENIVMKIQNGFQRLDND